MPWQKLCQPLNGGFVGFLRGFVVRYVVNDTTLLASRQGGWRFDGGLDGGEASVRLICLPAGDRAALPSPVAVSAWRSPAEQVGAQTGDNLAMQLANPRFRDAQHFADFAQVQIPFVMQGHQEFVAFGQDRDAFGQ